MTTPPDAYREWDAAYVLGSLSPAERRDYELHLADCPTCAGNVASLAGISGILSAVPPDRALALLSLDNAQHGVEEQAPNLMPKLLDAARRQQRRARGRVAALVVAAAVAAAVLALVVPRIAARDDDHDLNVVMQQTVPSPISADASLVAEPWGTLIEVTCRYAEPTEPPDAGDDGSQTFEYGLFVTGADGRSSNVASWTASPGSETKAVATTKLPIDEITSLDIRFGPTGDVLVEASL